MIRRLAPLILTPLIALPAMGTAAAQPPQAGPGTYLIHAGKILTMAGPPLDHASVLVRDGKIAAIGEDLKAPPGCQVLDYGEQFLLPGFVELHCHIGMSSGDINDMVLPHNMDLRTLDIARLHTRELAAATRAGITTVLMIPGSGSSIGGLGVLLKTSGGSFDQRLLRFPGAMKIALHARGGNPARRSGDLGSGRLGLHHMLKVVMQQARDYHLAWAAFERDGGDEPDHNPRLHPLRGLFRKEFPVLLHAYGSNDTMTAIRILRWGLDVPIIISHGMYDSFWVKEQLAAQGVPMNLGPRQYEFDESRFMGNAAELHGAGVPVSICTDAPVVAQDQLPLQAAMAVRLGLPTQAALRGLTIEPARAIGISDRLGSIEVGKDADLLVFPGDPIDPRFRPSLVMINGQVVVRRRGP